MTENYDIELIRSRLTTLGVSSEISLPYLAILTNLNALSVLLEPNNLQEAEAGEESLNRLLQEHQERRARWEARFPILVIATRTPDWKGN